MLLKAVQTGKISDFSPFRLDRILFFLDTVLLIPIPKTNFGRRDTPFIIP